MEADCPPLALRWNSLAGEFVTALDTPSTVAVRALAMVHTAMYNAWSAYADGSYASTTTAGRLQRTA